MTHSPLPTASAGVEKEIKGAAPKGRIAFRRRETLIYFSRRLRPASLRMF